VSLLNSQFSRAIALSFLTTVGTAQALDIDTAPSNEGTPKTEHTNTTTTPPTTISQALEGYGLSSEDKEATLSLVTQNMFRLSRYYRHPIEMEQLEEFFIEGLEKRPQQLEKAQKDFSTIDSKLTTLKNQYTELNSSPSSSEDELVDLMDSIIEAEISVESARKELRVMQEIQKNTPEILATIGLNAAFKELDPHSAFLSPTPIVPTEENIKRRKPGGIGAVLKTDGRSKYIINEGVNVQSTLDPADTSPAQKAGLKPGDLITHIDDTPLANRRLNDVVDDLVSGNPGSSIKLGLVRDGEPLEIKMNRRIIQLENVTSRIVDTNVAYIHINEFDDQVEESVKKSIEGIQEKLGGVDNVAGYIISVRDK